MWSGSGKGLRGRYVTPYGKSVKIQMWDVVMDAEETEKEVHTHLSQHKLEGELFSLEALDLAVTYLTKLYTEPEVL